jgi:hypothetical protein
MKMLIRDKLRLKGKVDNATLLELQNTVNGFRAHNAADRKAHFEFFLALEDPNDMDPSCWIVDHGLKEWWADYIALQVYGFGGHIASMFTDDGHIAVNNLIEGSIPKTGPPFKGNAGLMELAQEVHRKNRWKIRPDKTDPSEVYLQVQSAAEIREAIGAFMHTTVGQTNLFEATLWAGKLNWVASIPCIGDMGDFVINDPETGQRRYVTIDIPAQNRQEYQWLLDYAVYSKDHFGETDPKRVWDNEDEDVRFQESISKAQEWMFTTEELTPLR